MADRVLIIEDEADLAELMALYLRRHGCEVTLAPSGRDGMNALRAMKPDLIVLDIGLPDSDGMEICREIRRLSDVPIIFVTCRRDADDIRDGLSLGADDYVTKPFDPAELVARVQGHLRKRGVLRTLEHQEPPIWSDGRLVIDFGRMEIRAGGRVERLFTKEMQLLKFLVQHPNRVFGLDELFESVWGLDSDSDTKTVYAHIHNLRRKLERNLGLLDRIVTIRGIGYKWVAE